VKRIRNGIPSGCGPRKHLAGPSALVRGRPASRAWVVNARRSVVGLARSIVADVCAPTLCWERIAPHTLVGPEGEGRTVACVARPQSPTPWSPLGPAARGPIPRPSRGTVGRGAASRLAREGDREKQFKASAGNGLSASQGAATHSVLLPLSGGENRVAMAPADCPDRLVRGRPRGRDRRQTAKLRKHFRRRDPLGVSAAREWAVGVLRPGGGRAWRVALRRSARAASRSVSVPHRLIASNAKQRPRGHQ